VEAAEASVVFDPGEHRFDLGTSAFSQSDSLIANQELLCLVLESTQGPVHLQTPVGFTLGA